jgi:hypothetical protein
LGPGYGKRYNELNKLAVTVFSAVLAGDYEPLNAVLHERQRREQPVRDLIEMRMRQYAPRTGKVAIVVAHLTMPAALDGVEAAQTFVELKGEMGSIYFGLYWKDGSNIGIAPAMGPPRLSIPFLPLPDGGFAGYDLDLAMDFEIAFEAGEDDHISAMIFTSAGENIKAIRQE